MSFYKADHKRRWVFDMMLVPIICAIVLSLSMCSEGEQPEEEGETDQERSAYSLPAPEL